MWIAVIIVVLLLALLLLGLPGLIGVGSLAALGALAWFLAPWVGLALLAVVAWPLSLLVKRVAPDTWRFAREQDENEQRKKAPPPMAGHYGRSLDAPRSPPPTTGSLLKSPPPVVYHVSEIPAPKRPHR